MEPKPAFLIYRSSAGSGKTYTLVKEYLLLALEKPDTAYKHILAITFTNKAMQEMKSRIIENLSEFTSGKEHPMKDELIEHLKITEAQFSFRCDILLKQILHEYSYFSISTIDAFFQKIIRAFTKELGLYGQYQLELDQELVKIKAIDNLLGELKENDNVTNWLVKFAEEQITEGKSWNIQRNLSAFASEIFKESFVELEENLPDASSIRQFQTELQREIAIFKNTLKGFSSQALEVMKSNNLTPEEFSHKKSGAISFLLKVHNDDVKDPGKRSLQGCNDPDAWIAKNNKNKDTLYPIVQDQLMPLLSSAVEFYEKDKKKYYSALAVLKFIYGLGLLTDIAQKIQLYKRENDLLFIQDATLLIKKLMEESDSPFIFEKVGTFYEHYLIDEFQDTSAMQWHCLHPLVFDTVSSGNKSIIVGDSKQSIYRWRGGDWSLLQYQVSNDIFPHKSKFLYLDKNFRSGGEIVNFNNKLFKSLSKQLFDNFSQDQDDLKESTIQLGKQVAEVYNDTFQKAKDERLNDGYIQIKYLQPEDDGNWHELSMDQTLSYINDILNRGYQLKDIALLVRKRWEASLLAQYLLQFTDDGSPRYPVLTNEALLIKNSSTVMLIISTLKFLQNRDDKISLAEVVHNYFSLYSKEKLLYHTIFQRGKNANMEQLPFDLEKERLHLTHLPIEEVVEHLVRLFNLPGESGEAAYLQTFQDLVLKFGRSEGNDIDSFLQWWEEQGIKESINVPSGLDAITIMTIHKAKGLQFPVVIVPFVNWSTDSDNRSILWGKAEEKPYGNRPLPVRYSKGLEQTFFKDYYVSEQMQAALDSMNMLYVAFTRAEEELYALSPEDNKSHIGAHLKALFEEDAEELNQNWSSQELSYENGNKKEYGTKSETPNNQVQIDKYLSHDWRKRLVVKKIKGTHYNKEAIRGTRMHHLLSKIQHARDLEQSVFFKTLKDEDLKKQLAETIAHPDIEEYFTDDYEVLNEKSILRQHEILIPDRVVSGKNQTVVIDYKWGAVQDKYQHQVRSYIEILQQMGYKNIKGFLYYVDQKIVEKVA